MGDHIGYAARRLALRSALGLFGVLCLVIGLAFLTAAAWIALRIAADAQTAALVIGGAYAGLGLIVLAVARVARPGPPPPVPRAARTVHEAPITGVAAAFMEGLGAGLASSRRPRHG